MQPSYALLSATRNPKTVGGMCYAITGLTLIGLKHPLVSIQSQAREASFEGTFSLQLKLDSRPYQAPPKCEVYMLQKPFKDEF